MTDLLSGADSIGSLLRRCEASPSRVEMWIDIILAAGVTRMAEVGVYRGEFAEAVLRQCPEVARYYMVDPWRHLSDWNKPSNAEDDRFAQFLAEVKAKTEFAATRRVILRGTTTEVIDQVADGELDFVYIDGDHTLRGISIDLIRCYSKVRVGGLIGGDDFTPNMWQHKSSFEPTLVFPFAVYFAEAIGAKVYALPHGQFCIHKREDSNFEFVDLTGRYGELTLRSQLAPESMLKLYLRERFPRLMGVVSHVAGFRRS